MHTLYTLGYTGLKQAQLLEIVQTLGAMVVDTRFSPRSRAVQWTGSGLRKLLGESYLHLPSLGNVNYKGDGPIKINKPAEGIPQVVSLLAQQPVILLCVCGDVHTCHRKVVAELVQQACGCVVAHLKNGEISPLPSSTSGSTSGGYGEISPLTLISKPLPLHQRRMF